MSDNSLVGMARRGFMANVAAVGGITFLTPWAAPVLAKDLAKDYASGHDHKPDRHSPEIQPMTAPNPALPEIIYIIRHGEKPADLPAPSPGQPTAPPSPPFGVDFDGDQNVHSLLPRGWQRCGALTALFDPAVGAPQAGLRTPTALYATSYGNPDKTRVHREYQTIQGLAGRLGLPIQSPVRVGQESALVDAILAGGDEVVLICWEHHHIPALAQGIPTADATTIPAVWPDDRFDVIWTFALDAATGRYAFGQVPQQLLEGDSDTVI